MSNTANDPANMREETFRQYEQMAYSQIDDRVKQLEAENAKLRRQVEFAKRENHEDTSEDGTGFCMLCFCDHNEGQPHHPDCPHAEDT